MSRFERFMAWVLGLGLAVAALAAVAYLQPGVMGGALMALGREFKPFLLALASGTGRILTTLTGPLEQATTRLLAFGLTIATLFFFIPWCFRKGKGGGK